VQHLRSLRVILLIAVIVNVSWGYLFSFTPSLVEVLYGLRPKDDLHIFLSMSRGAFFFLLGLVALLGFLRPRGLKSLTLVLIVAYFFLFLVDVIILARGMMHLQKLLPEMVYFILVGAALVRFYPTKEEPQSKM
jgi:hypothetical protein